MQCPKCGEPYPGQQMWSVPLTNVAAGAIPYTWRMVEFNTGTALRDGDRVEIVTKEQW